MIRMCMIAPKAYPLFNPATEGVVGGAEVDLYYLATELAKDTAYTVSFLCADYGQAEEETWEGVRVLRSVNFKKNPLSGALRIWCGLKKADAQIYMIKTISMGMFLVALFCRLNKKQFVFRTSNKGSCDGTYLKRRPLMGKFYKCALKVASLVFVQNIEDVADLKSTTGVTSQALPNGHRLPELNPEAPHETILWVGRSVAIKRPERFLDLAEALPEQRFVMVCQRATGDMQYDTLRNRAEAMSNLTFLESVPFDEIHGYYDQAAVLVNTSDAEGFPNTFIEACQHGVPIVTVAVNPDGFLETNDCGACCEGDVKRLPELVSQTLTEPRRNQAGTNARRYVEEHHSIEGVAAVYKEAFQKLVG